MAVACPGLNSPKTSVTLTPTTGSPTPSAHHVAVDCLRRAAEEGRSPGAAPAATVTPGSGNVGSKLTIGGTGMPASMRLIVFAWFDSPDCQLPGDGRADHVLGTGQADARGHYRIALSWRRKFNPATSRGLAPEGYVLPPGVYWIIVVPCTADVGTCSDQLNKGSAIGAEFEFRT